MKKKDIPKIIGRHAENPHRRKILKSIQRLGQVHSIWNVFTDFVELGAIAIANGCDRSEDVWEKREETYRQTLGKYSEEEQKIFPEMLADLADALTYELTWENAPTDVLGSIFNELELYNKYKAQVFTPRHVCAMMGEMVLGQDGCGEAIKEKGYISLYEPACGGGAMIFGFAEAMLSRNLNYCSQLVVLATDVDLRCVYMAYLQLSLYGIPAVVTHGNALTLEDWSRWFTPVYVIHGWRWRSGIISAAQVMKAQNPNDSDKPNKPRKKNKSDNDGAEAPSQLSLF